MSKTKSLSPIDELLSTHRVILCCGPGGVGKTSLSAALALRGAGRLGLRTIVVTVDPAKRLGDAMGIHELDDQPTQIDPALLERLGYNANSSLSAAMLDSASSWDRMVRRYAPSAEIAEQIVANPLYRNITQRFVNAHEYAAVERLYELHRQAQYDLIIIDTPPSRHAKDLLEAPARLKEFFGSRLLKLLAVPGRNPVGRLAMKPFSLVANSILGPRFFDDISEFFALLSKLSDGFIKRAQAVEELLHDPSTAYVVVTSPEDGPVEESRSFIATLEAQGLEASVVIANRVTRPFLDDTRVSLGELIRSAATVELLDVAMSKPAKNSEADETGASKQGANKTTRTLAESLATVTDETQARATQQIATLANLKLNKNVALVVVPFFSADLHALDGLQALEQAL